MDVYLESIKRDTKYTGYVHTYTRVFTQGATRTIFLEINIHTSRRITSSSNILFTSMFVTVSYCTYEFLDAEFLYSLFFYNTREKYDFGRRIASTSI